MNALLTIPAVATVLGGFWLFVLTVLAIRSGKFLRQPLLLTAADVGLLVLFGAVMWTGLHDLVRIWL